MRYVVLALLLLLPLDVARSEPLWQTLPATPAPVPGEHVGHAKVNAINLYYATIGHGPPSCFCTAAYPIRTIGAIRLRRSLHITP